jgi:D-arabinose 1-dehydrogenase-like Zn-dependent alcohol dehydrogenase
MQVAVLGVGGLGHLAVQFAAKMGAVVSAPAAGRLAIQHNSLDV